VARNGLNPDNDGYYRIVASPVVHGDLIVARRASGRCSSSRRRPRRHQQVARALVVRQRTRRADAGDRRHLLYVVNDRGIMWCLDLKTGKESLRAPALRPATYSGSPVLADGKIYVTNEDGVTVVVKAGPTFQVLAENDFDDYTLSSPAVSEGQIFIRTATQLYCLGQRTAPTH
jgi:outer membrane protein assembly factor BamB